ncbi:glycosyltransferase family 4 protein [Sulfuriroseicoccus oceanibius]|uniref:Glycosyltransferase family 4 protein n=1 Tax=Sulfuriroseicoccus oceanibius TaxID=2707525 RepID=A0A6B3LAJ5_9BACT|nr:glycosyltransferase family 4 protein [Sulfuriroseicoccus oceanibius]QQL45528.1 glycosyltransferase family 4 protein [Sulfuriroseicoccus oceanibius]
MSQRRIAYLYSRYPVVSQTFCDSEMLELGRQDVDLVVASICPPKDSFRHERLNDLQAPVFHQPGTAVLKRLEAEARADGSWPQEMIDRHEREYGPSYKAATRARNALYFSKLFKRLGVSHFHVHFANRATHTALFIKAISGITFSFTPHAQDFMVDLGSDDLLREMCREAKFVVAVSDFSRNLLCETCPDSCDKITRIYNGIDPEGFPLASPGSEWANGMPLRIISVGRLIEFKGFRHLIDAVAKLKQQGIPVDCRIIGEGPWHERLSQQIGELGLEDEVQLLGRRSQDAVKAELLAADVFALPCIVDSKGASDILPTVITEAMACGLPIVSTHLVGVPEMVDDGVTGFLAEPGNSDELVAAFTRLFERPQLAYSMGRAGRERMERIFALKVTAGQLKEHLMAAVADDAAAGTPAELMVLTDSLPQVSEDLGDAALAQELNWLLDCSGVNVLSLTEQGACAMPEPLARHIGERLEFVPDGMVLEMEWRSRTEWRQQMENLRCSLHQAIDGETFLLHARRAVWLAQAIERNGVKRVHASRSECALVAWLVSRLIGVPFTVGVEEGAAWSSSLWKHILKDADKVSIADHRVAKKAEQTGTADTLHLAVPELKVKRLGPIRWRQQALPIATETRKAALMKFLSLG